MKTSKPPKNAKEHTQMWFQFDNVG